MSSLPRRTNETDAEWQAMLARIGKFNEENYGKKKPGNPAPPMTKGPVSPKAPPPMTKGPMSPKIAPTAVRKLVEQPAPKPPLTKGPLPPKTAPTAVRNLIDQPAPKAPLTKGPTPPKTAPTAVRKLTMQTPAPIKKAAGGAAKVRKGMMTSEGVITNAMNKVRGK